MRDDYGCEPQHVSAWAGIHYFAGRRGWAAEGAGENVLTWPEGNDRLARGMAAAFPDAISTDRIVHRVARDGDGIVVDSFDTAAGRTVRTIARAAILAMPHFIARRIAPEDVRRWDGLEYAPWLVANVTVARLPTGPGAPPACAHVPSTRQPPGYGVATPHGPAARAAILAMPHFIARRIAPEDVRRWDGLEYAPWLVANVTVDRLPTGRGAPLAWDNVSSTSESLGYVVATHQGPAARTAGTVLTWYMPLSRQAPAEARRLLLERPEEEWRRIVLDDQIGRAHV